MKKKASGREKSFYREKPLHREKTPVSRNRLWLTCAGILCFGLLAAGMPGTSRVLASDTVETVETEQTSDAVQTTSAEQTAETAQAHAGSLSGEDLHDGAYAIEVSSDTDRFGIEDSLLIVENGDMRALLTLTGDYTKLFSGTAEDAREAEESDFAVCEQDESGNRTCMVPVRALDEELVYAGLRADDGQWQEDTLTFVSDSLPKGTLKTTASQAYQTMELQKLDEKDGLYTVEVSMTGGTGKASIESPASVTIMDGIATVELVWSSNHYDFMVVNGEKYTPVSTEEHSVFRVPVVAFDTPFAVTADTTAMSEAHEIEYMLKFDSDTLQMNGTNRRPVLSIVVVAVIALAFLFGYRNRRKSSV